LEFSLRIPIKLIFIYVKKIVNPRISYLVPNGIKKAPSNEGALNCNL
jgi:hypothetical protein